MKRALRIAQQFGAAAGALLRERFTDVEVVDVARGPEGFGVDDDMLLAAPSKSWAGRPRPAEWPGALRLVQLPGVGIDGYPDWMFEAPTVCTAPGLNTSAIAEFVLASMLAHEKSFPATWIHGAGEWSSRALGTLRGRTLALAGVGAIGGAVARHALAFGMQVVAFRRSAARPMEGVKVYTDFMSLAPHADHLVLCMPSTPETRHQVNARFLAACRPGLHLVNVARGDLIDQSALLAALDAGIVAAASLDVTTPEPLPAAHPFYTHARVRLSPHVAWSSPDTVMRLTELFADQVTRWRTGQRPRFIADAPTPPLLLD